jgi:3-oxoacyl-[acyl-carrier-protein] synthase I
LSIDSAAKRIAVTGMSINTPLGDTLEAFLDGLLAGRSAVTRWKTLDTSRIYAKVGADLSDYDIRAKLSMLASEIPPEVHHRLRRLVSRAPWSTQLSMLLAVDGFRDAGLFDFDLDPTRVAAIVAGHNINFNYQYENRLQFAEEPDFMDSMLSLHGLDTDHAGCISEVLHVQGPIYTIGAACASANAALRCGVDEIRHHDVDVAVVTGAVLDFSPIELHAMALMGAITYQSFNDEPSRASRPFDTRREGFVPAHGGGVLVLEDLDVAVRRGAHIYAEVLGVESNSDANHLPQPSAEGQARLMAKVLRQCHLAPEEIDYLNAHATSTPLGDVTEIRSIKQVFGAHAYRLKLNATKSMLGHTCWAAPVVETVAAVLQMGVGRLHPSINVDDLDPEVDLDVCAGRDAVAYPVRTVMKNSFGFGGINSVSVLRRFEVGR